MTKQVAVCGPRLVGSLMTLATAVSWPQLVNSDESIGLINVNVTVVDSCEVVADADLSIIDQVCANMTEVGHVTITPSGDAVPPSMAADAITIIADESDADVQLITISY